MKATIKSALLLTVLLVGLSNCRKSNVDPQLPAETITGQHTFGCLVNGKVWLPGGKILLGRPFLEINYDPNYDKGTLAIRANINNYEKAIGFTASGVNRVGLFHFVSDSTLGVIYRDETASGSCKEFFTDHSYPKQKIVDNQLIINRLDLANGVIAGRFAFTLAQPGCDTIRITDGRFDRVQFKLSLCAHCIVDRFDLLSNQGPLVTHQANS